jgi:hypothetical protein
MYVFKSLVKPTDFSGQKCIEIHKIETYLPKLTDSFGIYGPQITLLSIYIIEWKVYIIIIIIIIIIYM